MKQEQKFFLCKVCGNLVGMILSGDVPMTCCDEVMTELVPNTSDGAGEKHVPVIVQDGKKVTVEVGSVAHPMLAAHYIMWVYIQTAKGGQRQNLLPGDEPKAEFILSDGDKLVAAFEYCNLHGLWKAEA